MDTNPPGNASAIPKTASRTKKNVVLIWSSAVGSFLICGAICAFIAYDNRLISTNDTPEEFKQHTHELKIVLTESFIGAGILGAAIGVAAVFFLGKATAPIEDSPAAPTEQ